MTKQLLDRFQSLAKQRKRIEILNKKLARHSSDLELSNSDKLNLVNQFALLSSSHTHTLATNLSLTSPHILPQLLTPQDLSLYLTTLAWANIKTPTLDPSITSLAVSTFSTGPDSDKHLASVHDYWLHSTPSSTSSIGWMQLLMRSRGAVQICTACLGNHNISSFYRHVGEYLEERGGFVQNQLCVRSGFHLDFVDFEGKVVVDCVGSSHYITDYYIEDEGGEEMVLDNELGYKSRFVLSGPNAFKKRILEGFGWKVLVVPYYKWVRKQKGDMRRKWLFRELDAILLD